MNSDVVILAAGISSRMGKIKALLPFNKEHTFLSKIISTYIEFGCEKIVVVVSSDLMKFINEEGTISSNSNVRFIENSTNENGRMSSVILGLKNIQGQNPIFLQDIDRPFVNIEVLEKLYSNSIDEGYTTPSYNGKSGHPVLIDAYIAKEIISNNKDELNLKETLEAYKRKKVAVEDSGILININSPADYVEHFGTKMPLV